ncbi:transmembrane protein 120B isoform X4 [Macaca nemestrina]|uniref:transmembrane protein 120B isoform X6 n=1 Tax=Macaca fascicularis TaxID=9541 RepID=UPI001E255899|nr:transmembrane protein 120B isoform X5 [Macaca fascicularis]
MSGQLERCEREWHELEGEFQELQETHRIYKQKLEELAALQTLCSSSISKQKKHLKDLKLTLQRCKRHTSQEEAELVQQMAANIKERQDVFFDMEAYLPKKNGVTDEVFNFLLVWYYCTLTIRESILISNGSRIKGWWVSHHYVSTFLSGVMLTWPNGPIYQKFRNQFLAFSIFQIKTHQPSLGAERRCCPVFWGHHALSPGAVLPLQAAYSSCNIITRGAASTGCGPWGRGTTWILQWKGSSPGCGGASPFSCPSSSVAISGSSTMPSRSLSSPATRNAENGRCSCWRSPSSSSSSATS